MANEKSGEVESVSRSGQTVYFRALTDECHALRRDLAEATKMVAEALQLGQQTASKLDLATAQKQEAEARAVRAEAQRDALLVVVEALKVRGHTSDCAALAPRISGQSFRLSGTRKCSCLLDMARAALAPVRGAA